jgi:hypothetical protein
MEAKVIMHWVLNNSNWKFSNPKIKRNIVQQKSRPWATFLFDIHLPGFTAPVSSFSFIALYTANAFSSLSK